MLAPCPAPARNAWRIAREHAALNVNWRKDAIEAVSSYGSTGASANEGFYGLRLGFRSARSSQNKASSMSDGIWSSLDLSEAVFLV
jgi:hypothetical protein